MYLKIIDSDRKYKPGEKFRYGWMCEHICEDFSKEDYKLEGIRIKGSGGDHPDRWSWNLACQECLVICDKDDIVLFSSYKYTAEERENRCCQFYNELSEFLENLLNPEDHLMTFGEDDLLDI
jgi:hypothetical protein